MRRSFSRFFPSALSTSNSAGIPLSAKLLTLLLPSALVGGMLYGYQMALRSQLELKITDEDIIRMFAGPNGDFIPVSAKK